jgi:hypothetical protein
MATRQIVRIDEERAETLMKEREQVYADMRTWERRAPARPLLIVCPMSQRCFRCDTGEDQAYLVPVRHPGRLWVCTKCLPALIHG